MLTAPSTLCVGQSTIEIDSATNSGPTYYVAPWGDDNNAGSAQAPWATLHHASSSLQPGTTIVVRGGIYVNDSFRVPSGSSTQQQPITVVAYTGEVPTITGSGSYDTIFTISSPTIVDGLTFFRPLANDVVDIWSNYVTVQNCTFRETNGQFIRINGTNHITIENNIFDTNGYIDTDGEDDAIAILGASNVLIQKNYATRNGHYFANAIYKSQFGPSKNIVVRDNTLEQHWGGGIGETGQGSLNMLIENNRISNVGEGVAYIKTNFLLNASNNIVRGNILTNEAGWYNNNGLLLVGEYDLVDSSSEYNRIYNNVFYQIGYLPVFLSQRESSGENPPVFNYVTNNRILNNILYQDETQGAIFYYPANTAYISAETYHSPDKPWPFFPYYNYFFNNLIGDDPGNNGLFQYVTPTYTSEWNLSTVQSDYSTYISRNIQANPEFVNPATGDFRLSASSPAIAAGAHLAHTTAAGKSTTVPVDDAYFFCNGFGVVPGDSIKIGTNAPVTVTSVNYKGGILTVSSSVSFSRGDLVDLAGFTGSAPDMGAYAFSSSEPDILNLGAAVQSATTPLAAGAVIQGLKVGNMSLVGSGSSVSARVTISWSTSEPATTQVLYSSGDWYRTYFNATPITNVSGSTSHVVTLTGLLPNATYHFAVQSTDSSGRTSYSGDEVFTTPAAKAPGPALSQISAKATSGATAWFPPPKGQGFAPSGKNCCGYSFSQVTISWKANVTVTRNTVLLIPVSIGGSVETAELNSSTQATVSGNPAATTAPSLTIYQLAPATTYEYRVQSTDSSGHTTTSPSAEFTTPAVN